MKKDEETVTSDVLAEENEKILSTDRTGYSYETSLNYRNVDWMGNLRANLRLSELSIPGTHGSTALHGKTGFDENNVRNQRMSITTQLNSGIRYLDIRARRTGTTFAMHHGPVYQQKMFGDVLQEMITFLRQNPKETILMRLKEEHTAEDGSLSFEEIFKKYWNNNISYFWNPNSFSGTDKTNPKLGDVRGKIIVVQNFTASQTYGIYYSSLSPQDLAEIDNNADAVYSKWTKVKEKLVEAHGSSKSTIYLNHLSANARNVWEGIVGFVNPWFIASGNQNRTTNSGRKHVFDRYSPGNPNHKYPDYPTDIYGERMYEGTNNLTMQWIQRGSVQHTGIIAADFPGKGLIDSVINLNAKFSATDIHYVRTNDQKQLEVGFTGSEYLKKKYIIYKNGSFIAGLDHGKVFYASLHPTDFGHQLRYTGTLFNGDKIDVYLDNNGNRTLLKSHTVSIKEDELEEIRVADGPYIIMSALNNTSAIDMHSTSDRNIILWDYVNQIKAEFDFQYVASKNAYLILNRWDPKAKMSWSYIPGSINVFGNSSFAVTTDADLWVVKRAGEGYVYLFNKKNGHVLDVTGGGTANGTNINVWGRVPGERNQMFKLIQRKEIKQAEINSEYKPSEGQSHRSSGNFNLNFLSGKQVRVMIEGSGAANLSFSIKRDQTFTDPTFATNVKNGSFITIPTNKNWDNIYIADPNGYSSNGTFKVKFYTLQN
ncbi:TPA: phosphatidylinositol-specific phospholipase C domain-containing protein [Bacillus cereus]|nr:phosphatidylinositol-specific phospholipase C domain-containing protein [Bacillus cereus]